MPIDLRARARERLSRECGTIFPKQAAARLALVFPNIYKLGMASLGFQLVYRMLNDLPNASCERAFLPDPDELTEHERTRAELFSLETQTPLSRFDALAFSVSFEMDYLNVLCILRLANIPVESAGRNDSHPIVIAGGICATFNPEPLVDFIDAFVIGDAEPILTRLVDALQSAETKSERLRRLADIPGVYVPSVRSSENVQRVIATDLAPYLSASVITTPEAEFGAIELVEVARGCGRGCRFCVAGHVTRPPRPRENLDVSKSRAYGLVGAAVFDHPHVIDLCRRIIDAGGRFSVSSLRLETVTPEVAALLAAGGQRTLTVAPEAGSIRLRKVIGKSLPPGEAVVSGFELSGNPETLTGGDEAIFAAVSNAHDAGIAKIKLYFMIGLPTETDEDADEIALLARRLADAFPAVSFQVSVSCFVPKPWTPFQWHPMETEAILKRRFARIRKTLAGAPKIKLTGESPRLSLIQGLLTRGDRQVGRFLLHALDNGGDYRAALRESGIDIAQYLHRPRDRDEVFPWDHIAALPEKSRLWAEYERALNIE